MLLLKETTGAFDGAWTHDLLIASQVTAPGLRYVTEIWVPYCKAFIITTLYIPKQNKQKNKNKAKIEKLDDRNMFNFCFLSISSVILPIPVCHSKSLLSKIENSRKVPIFDGRDTLNVSYKCRSGLVMHSLKNNHLTFFSRIIKHTILVHLYKWSANLELLNQLFMFILRL